MTDLDAVDAMLEGVTALDTPEAHRLKFAAGIPDMPTQITFDARNAIAGVGPMAGDWQDKPHRVVYDLCRAIERTAAADLAAEVRALREKLEATQRAHLVGCDRVVALEDVAGLIERTLESVAGGYEKGGDGAVACGIRVAASAVKIALRRLSAAPVDPVAGFTLTTSNAALMTAFWAGHAAGVRGDDVELAWLTQPDAAPPDPVAEAMRLPQIAALVDALEYIADEASVPVRTWKNGINFKKLYEGWRKIAVNRIDHARTALAALKEASHD